MSKENSTISPTNPMVSIPFERYLELLNLESWVSALEAAGVDNWDGIDQAREFYTEDEVEEEEDV